MNEKLKEGLAREVLVLTCLAVVTPILRIILWILVLRFFRVYLPYSWLFFGIYWLRWVYWAIKTLRNRGEEK